MKKFAAMALATLIIAGTAPQVQAANNISNMAVLKGGQHVAECARTMDRGLSGCLGMAECAK
ncbi:hypothetical protein [Anaerotalea alkaliphila]|uniref:Uncharacterized protein n=1 Tax=Anaerotalea alkaliphila TaxID=2662126 RepID=A0A7X5KLV5_9FIRM|nr:hypothetical protein [Anaerotalea alkaliphila]NDL67261.1 hypothetical protein [Anaerotalea alkaliphila]